MGAWVGVERVWERDLNPCLKQDVCDNKGGSNKIGTTREERAKRDCCYVTLWLEHEIEELKRNQLSMQLQHQQQLTQVTEELLARIQKNEHDLSVIKQRKLSWIKNVQFGFVSAHQPSS